MGGMSAGATGTLSGYTLVERHDGGKHLQEHETNSNRNTI